MSSKGEERERRRRGKGGSVECEGCGFGERKVQRSRRVDDGGWKTKLGEEQELHERDE